jgi:hypothetical protein
VPNMPHRRTLIPVVQGHPLLDFAVLRHLFGHCTRVPTGALALPLGFGGGQCRAREHIRELIIGIVRVLGTGHSVFRCYLAPLWVASAFLLTISMSLRLLRSCCALNDLHVRCAIASRSMFAYWLWGNFKGMEGRLAKVASFLTVFAERCPRVCAWSSSW